MDDNTKKYMTYPTWRKHLVLSTVISSIQIKQKRTIFQLLRSNSDADAFLPEFGFTSGSFCIWQILSENKRRKKS